MNDEKREKIFILDTNVILHDSECIYKFQENQVVIPITVIEELDKFKKGNDTLNFHARHFLRAIDGMRGDKIFENGVIIGEGLGRLRVKLSQKFQEDFEVNFPSTKPDHHILYIAQCQYKDHPDKDVVLVSKDVNLRMKAKSIGIESQDYRSDHVTDISDIYKGYRVEEDVDPQIITSLYKRPNELPADAVKFKKDLWPNEYLIMRSGKQSVLARFNASKQKICRVDKRLAQGIVPRNAEQTFAMNAMLDKNVELVTITGRAGTGKTLLALASALESKKNYRQIFLARPIVPLSNKDIGYLPGDAGEKIEPYMQPLFDNLGVIKNDYIDYVKNHKQIQEILKKEKLVIAPLAYIRGRSLVNVYFIVDEAQNLTPHEIKTIITRAGEGTKLVFTGDIFQIDHPYLDTYSNGLSHLIDKMRGQKFYTHINLEKGERSELAEVASNLL